jgi:Putative rhamnosyl transferase
MVDGHKVQVLGLCRFSYPAELEGFQTRHATMADRRAALYDPARMETRLFWFEHIALPGLRAQTRDDFTLLLLMGDDLPQPWRNRLLAMIKDVPQIRPVYRATGPHRLIYRETLQAARDPGADMVAEFRLDDDDAVAVNYVQTIRRAVPQIRPLFRQKGRVALDQGKGVVVTADGAEVTLAPVISHCWAAALTVFLKPGDEACVMDFPHQKVWQRMPLVSYSDQLMFLRGAHATNDSAVGFAGTGSFKLEPKDALDLLARRFGVDIAGFRAGWAALSRRL